MATINDVDKGKCLTILEDGQVSSFVRVEKKLHKGKNARCLMSSEHTYEEGEYYFIQLDAEVIPTLT